MRSWITAFCFGAAAALWLLCMSGCPERRLREQSAATRPASRPATRPSPSWIEETLDACRKLEKKVDECEKEWQHYPWEPSWGLGSMFLARYIVGDLWRLWRVTGHCFFSDLARGLPLVSVRRVVARYREFVARNKRITEEELQTRGLLHSAELLKTHYWHPTILHIWRTVFLRTHLWSSGPLGTYPMPKEQRLKLYSHFKSWLGRHRHQMVWDGESKRFKNRTRWIRGLDGKLHLLKGTGSFPEEGDPDLQYILKSVFPPWKGGATGSSTSH